MNFFELLRFLPLLIGAFLAYHLIFRLQLPTKSIGSIVTYFIGILIVFFAVALLIRSFVPDFANDLLTAGREGQAWEDFFDGSRDILIDAGLNTTGDGDSTITVTDPSQNQIVVTVTPIPDDVTILRQPETVIEYTVVSGDTLFSIAGRFGVTVEDLRAANNIPPGQNIIVRGQKLVIPAQR